ncbi:Fc receptor-like A [Passer montanus]|uniref:Fc receptor-like A n=1 Tax=Passer montanus TaxID=9160 RepID=UPI001961A9BD|nr:Fc receptor-like A [Passer montanus]
MEKKLRELRDGTELSLSSLQLQHSGRYHCGSLVKSRVSRGWEESPPVTVTVHELFPVPVLEGPPEPPMGSLLNLSCLSTPSTLRPRAPLLHVFYRDGQVVGGPQGSPQLLVPAVGVSHSGHYSCQVHSEGGAVKKSSAWLRVTVRSECGDWHGETSQPPWVLCLGISIITRVPPSLTVSLHPSLSQPHPSLQFPHGLQVLPSPPWVGSAPVTFTWLHNGQEVAQGPILELRAVNVGHSGTYRCVATNQLDGHQAFSPELDLAVTTQEQRTALRKQQERHPFILTEPSQSP